MHIIHTRLTLKQWDWLEQKFASPVPSLLAQTCVCANDVVWELPVWLTYMREVCNGYALTVFVPSYDPQLLLGYDDPWRGVRPLTADEMDRWAAAGEALARRFAP